MNSLPRDISLMILDYLDDIDLAYTCATNKNMKYKICNNSFWLNKIKEIHGLDIDDVELEPDQSYAGYYFDLGLYNWNTPSGLANNLMYAAKSGRFDLLKAALYHGAWIDSVKYFEGITTAIGLASEEGNYDIVKYLLENGANVSGQIGEFAVIGARKNGHQDIVDLLTEYINRDK